LYKLKKRFADDKTTTAKLDGVSATLFASKRKQARAVMLEISSGRNKLAHVNR